MPTDRKVRIIDDPSVTEVYATHFIGAVFDGNAYILTFATQRAIPAHIGEQPDTSRPQTFVTARIALSQKAALETILSLKRLTSAAAPPPSMPPPSTRKPN